MAKLYSFTICESLNNMPAGDAGSIPMLIAPQIALRPQFIPGNFSFAMAIGVSEIDLKQLNKMRFTIAGPDGTILNDSGENELPIVPKPDLLPAEYQGFMMCIDVRNLVIPSEGMYIVSLYLNGEQFAAQGIPIYNKVD